MTEDGHAGRIYNLTGPEVLSLGEMAKKLSAALNRKIELADVSPEAMRRVLKAGEFPEWQLEGLIEDYAYYASSAAAEIASGVSDSTGKSPRYFDDFARDCAPAFTG